MATAPDIWLKRANNHKLDGPEKEVVIQLAFFLGFNEDYCNVCTLMFLWWTVHLWNLPSMLGISTRQSSIGAINKETKRESNTVTDSNFKIMLAWILWDGTKYNIRHVWHKMCFCINFLPKTYPQSQCHWLQWWIDDTAHVYHNQINSYPITIKNKQEMSPMFTILTFTVCMM